MNQEIIVCEKGAVRYGRDSVVFHALDVCLKAGGFYYLTGPSGSGKSTFLKLLYLGIPLVEGRLRILGEDVRFGRSTQRARLRQEMGIVFQDFKLLPHLTVVENVALALRIRGLSGEKSDSQARELLAWVGVEAGERFPQELSGGEQQRAVIARAVIARPRVIIADEPTGSLDEEVALKVMYLFEELHKLGTTVILATHHRDLTTAFPHDILSIQDQSIVQEGVSQTLDRPFSFSFGHHGGGVGV
jgi:cell division transport system ATP-binding protein